MWPFALAGLVAVISLLGVRQAVLTPRAAGPAPTTLAAGTKVSPPTVAAEAWASVRPVGSSCPDSHPIKGNINGEGERIFHVEGQRYYKATNPEACFTDADAAVAEGFRASLR